MATLESEKRMERRRRQRGWEEWNRQPEVITLRREIDRRQRYQAKHPYAGQPGLSLLHCVLSCPGSGSAAERGRGAAARSGLARASAGIGERLARIGVSGMAAD